MSDETAIGDKKPTIAGIASKTTWTLFAISTSLFALILVRGFWNIHQKPGISHWWYGALIIIVVPWTSALQALILLKKMLIEGTNRKTLQEVSQKIVFMLVFVAYLLGNMDLIKLLFT